jgi:iron(III) transport system ATP-binding protein
MKSIRVEDITKYYGLLKAVDRVSFDVEAGEMVTLLGPSGCGKTTTLRLIAGLEQPVGGSIWVGDKLVSSAERGVFVAPEKRGMGMVFQSYALWPNMTVYENVAYPLKRRKVPAKEIPERVATALRLVDMSEFHARPAPLLSGGQAQRVALARALVFNPDVLLLDEPLSNLDARLREEMRFGLRALQARVGVTTIFVTHDQAEAMVLSDRTIVMSTGRVEQVGPPDEVYERPASRFVMDFLGQVNHLMGQVRHGPDGALEAMVSDAGGATLPIFDERAWSDGEPVVLAFRPHEVTLRPANGNSDWIGTVQAAAYMGTHIEYLVQLGTTQIRVVGPCADRLTSGTSARCEISARAVRVWPA